MSDFYSNLTSRCCLFGLLIAIMHGLTGCASQLSTEQRRETVPFLGIETKSGDSDKGVRIARLWPGPVLKALQQDIEIDIRRDVLITIDGKIVTSENFRKSIDRLVPGQRVTLGFKEPSNSEMKTKKLHVVTGTRNDWTGPIAKHDAAMYALRQKALPQVEADTGMTVLLKTAVTDHGLATAVQDLHHLFDDWQRELRGYNTLSRVLFPFQQPYRLAELQQQISSPLLAMGEDSQNLLQEVARNLDLTAPVLPDCSQELTFNTLLQTVTEAQAQLSRAFPGWTQEKLDRVHADLRYLLSELTQLRTLERQLFPERSLNAMNSSMSINYDSLLAAAAGFTCLANSNQPITLDEDTQQSLPADLLQAVTGEIKAAIKSEHGWMVYGGAGDNEYDLEYITAVYDAGGSDVYRSSGYRAGTVKLIVDHAGDDRYETTSAWLGITMLIDHAGDDLYTGELAANGTGMMGIGMLIDRAGNDIYTGQYFSNGAAFYGAGLLLDLGNGTDSYQSGGFSQGIGGPRALGLIYDEGGDDHYQANYRMPSVYGTDKVYAGFSQGFGFGMRYYDSGGIGMIVDRQGNDHYDGGEFSQGGAYYWGLGILHDHVGDDIYKGKRYSQGFGVHQASGVLRDNAGNDRYQGMTAACQGAAWDVALGLLIDMNGDDSYQGDGLCQGAAAMQAQAWLIDLDGKDAYFASGDSVQGNSGRNHYHFNPEQPVYSWSVLADIGNGSDRYSFGHNINQVTTSSQFYELAPGNSRAYGLFIDLPIKAAIY